MALPRLILASASPRRAELLRQLNVPFEIIPSEVGEIDHQQLTACEVAQINAHRKARAIAKRFPDFLVLGANTVVGLDGMLFGKPSDLADARRMLRLLQGRTHEVATGVCLTYLRHRREELFAEITFVTFHPLGPEPIDQYLTTINPLDKAGGYAIQHAGFHPVDHVEGCFLAVVGLPLPEVLELLALARWPVPQIERQIVESICPACGDVSRLDLAASFGQRTTPGW